MEPKNTIADIVKSRINTFKEGYVFSYMDIDGPTKNREAIIKALNRLVEKGIIDKLAKGKFYKPTKSEYGRLGPDLSEIVKDLLEHKGEQIGYLTGHSIFNKLRLTLRLFMKRRLPSFKILMAILWFIEPLVSFVRASIFLFI